MTTALLQDAIGAEDKEWKDNHGGYFEIEILDEWAVSDHRKTLKQAQTPLRVFYSKLTSKNHPSLHSDFRNADGFVMVEQISNTVK